MKRRHVIVPVVVVLAGGFGVLALLQDRGLLTGMGAHAAVVRANNQFAVDLYQKLRTGQDNLLFSPYSIFNALGMAYAGARGTTQKQMSQAMSLSEASEVPEELARMYGSLAEDLDKGSERGKYELNIANAMWGQQSTAFLPDFVKLIESEYEGKLQTVDFAQSSRAAETMNKWVAEQTKGKITNMVSPGDFDEMTRLVLANAIYFKGKWVNPFSAATPKPFRPAGGGLYYVPMMSLHATLAYAETDDLQIVELPYVGGRISMVILLPRTSDGIRQLEARLTAQDLSAWAGSVRRVEVMAWVPKFKGTIAPPLKPVLESLGMKEAFDQESADFSGLAAAKERIYIWDVRHKAYIDVDEEGTEAAAATFGIATSASRDDDEPSYKTFIADHPFLYLIRDRASGVILFLGRMMDPGA
jgi:serpin B